MAVLDDTAQPTATFGPLPNVAPESHAVDVFKLRYDARMETDQVILDCLSVHSLGPWLKQAALAADGAMTNITSHLAFGELDLLGNLVGAPLGDAHRIAERCHAQDPPAAG